MATGSRLRRLSRLESLLQRIGADVEEAATLLSEHGQSEAAADLRAFGWRVHAARGRVIGALKPSGRKGATS